MKYLEYSHRHGKELLSLTHPEEYEDITSALSSLDPFPHGAEKNKTPKEHIAGAFEALGWELETEIPLGTGKSDYCDLSKNEVFIEQEYSRFEMFFRDFFRFLLLHDERARASQSREWSFAIMIVPTPHCSPWGATPGTIISRA